MASYGREEDVEMASYEMEGSLGLEEEVEVASYEMEG